MSTDIDQLRHLPIADKLRLVEELWDDIHSTDEPLVLRDWHQDEAKRRAVELELDREMGITRDELWNRVGEIDG